MMNDSVKFIPKNDPDNKLMIGDYLKTKQQINVFDLSFDVNRVGYGSMDYTSIIAENGFIETLLVEASYRFYKKSIWHNLKEYFILIPSELQSTKYTKLNNVETADRMVSLSFLITLDKTTKTIDNNPSVIFDMIFGKPELLTQSDEEISGKIDWFVMDVLLTSKINLRTGNLITICYDNHVPYIDGLDLRVVGYVPNFRYDILKENSK